MHFSWILSIDRPVLSHLLNRRKYLRNNTIRVLQGFPSLFSVRTHTSKHLIVCCDGTGQSSSGGEPTVPTNVTRFCQALKTSEKRQKEGTQAEVEEQQVVLYQAGLGTNGTTPISEFVSEIFGIGFDAHVLEAYNFFVHNYEKDDKLYLFGFSRGAFAARAIAAFICNAGLLKKEYVQYLPIIYRHYKRRRDDGQGFEYWNNWVARHAEAMKPKLHADVNIDILGLWDTVGSLGIPDTWVTHKLKLPGVRSFVNRLYPFHNTSLPSSTRFAKISHAYQALALDEHRIPFSPTLLYSQDSSGQEGNKNGTIIKNCWFLGVHGDVGGGYHRAYRDLSDISLLWMIDHCRASLSFDEDLIKKLETPSLSRTTWLPTNEVTPRPWGLSFQHNSVTFKYQLVGSRVRKLGEYLLDKKYNGGKGFQTNEFIHPSVRLRMDRSGLSVRDNKWENYCPQSLAGFDLQAYTTLDGKSWKWVKEDIIKGERRKIEIPEYPIFREGELQLQLMDENAKEVLNK